MRLRPPLRIYIKYVGPNRSVSFFCALLEITFEIVTAAGFPIRRMFFSSERWNVPVINARVWHVTETKMTPGWMEIKSLRLRRYSALKLSKQSGQNSRGKHGKIGNLVAARFDSFEMEFLAPDFPATFLVLFGEKNCILSHSPSLSFFFSPRSRWYRAMRSGTTGICHFAIRNRERNATNKISSGQFSHFESIRKSTCWGLPTMLSYERAI